MSKVALTAAFHEKLKACGYKYLLITNVEIVCPQNRILHITLKPGKSIPACQHYSCTGIDDTMIKGILARTAVHGSNVFVEMPEL